MPLKLENRADTAENQISYVDTNLKAFSQKKKSKYILKSRKDDVLQREKAISFKNILEPSQDVRIVGKQIMDALRNPQ